MMLKRFIRRSITNRDFLLIHQACFSDSFSKGGYETLINTSTTPPELTSVNYIVICGRVHRGPQWYMEEGKRLLTFGVRTTYSRIKKDIIKMDGKTFWSHSTLMSRHHRCVCGHTLLGEEKLDLQEISKVAAGDLVLVRGSIRYPSLHDRIVDYDHDGTDLLVTYLSIVAQGDGRFNNDMLYTQDGKKINIQKLNKGISSISKYRYSG